MKSSLIHFGAVLRVTSSTRQRISTTSAKKQKPLVQPLLLTHRKCYNIRYFDVFEMIRREIPKLRFFQIVDLIYKD